MVEEHSLPPLNPLLSLPMEEKKLGLGLQE